MLYRVYQLQDDLLGPWKAFAALSADAIRAMPAGVQEMPMMRAARAAAELVPFAGFRHERPAFGIASVEVDGETVAVEERVVAREPFVSLLHFAKPGIAGQPRVLVVAPLSGHYATLLRATVETMLPEHDVYLTDWHNARDVPAALGPFGLDDFIANLIDGLHVVGEGAHLMAVCQPCPAALAATALMAVDGDPCIPLSLTLMAGPVDARANANSVNAYADSYTIEWFERNVITEVPDRYAGAGRRVYPGFLQAVAFISMNDRRHRDAFHQMYVDIATGADDRAARAKSFYDEYLTVLDIDASFFLETVERVFQRHDLGRGEFRWRGRLVEPAAIRDVALLTIEGANDDITAPGQTAAAHSLCSGIAPELHSSHVQSGVGHYGVFSGGSWEREIYPIIREAIRAADAGAAGR